MALLFLNYRRNLNKFSSIFFFNSSLKSTSASKREKVNEPLDLTFTDHVAAFKSKSTFEILRAYIVYQLCSINWLVDNNTKLMKVSQKVLGKYLFTKMMKATFYGHFVAGENEKEIQPLLRRLLRHGIKPILDYSAEEDISSEEAKKREMSSSVSEAAPGTSKGEKKAKGSLKYQVNEKCAGCKVKSARTYFYLNEKTCDEHMETYQNCISTVSRLTPAEGVSQVVGRGISAVKLTALARPQLLLQLSEVITRTRLYMEEITGGKGNVIKHKMTLDDLKKNFESHGIKGEHVTTFLNNTTSDSQGLIHLFPWSGIIDENLNLSETFRVPDLKNGKMTRLISQITNKEEEMFRNVIKRMNTLAKMAVENDVRIMVDAEHSYFQPAISRITLELMRKYNKDKSYIQNTYQCYMKDTYNECMTDLDQAKRQKFYFGAKLVRGAYLDLERARAKAMGYEDPTCDSFEATTLTMNKTMQDVLKRIKLLKEKGTQKPVVIMMASHNEESTKYTIEKMNELGIDRGEETVLFGQLLGMCDYITFPLGQSGYCAYKYVPYGPVMDVMPYLSRRALENKGVLVKTKKEKRMLFAELKSRIKSNKIFYKPKE